MPTSAGKEVRKEEWRGYYYYRWCMEGGTLDSALLGLFF